MEKKITLKEFFDSEELLCIHCDTEEKSNTLIEAIGKVNKEYYFVLKVDISIYGTRWNKYTNATVFDNRGQFGNVESAKKLKYTIYEFDEVDLGEEYAVIDDLKKLLRNQVSDEIKNKIENLEKENKQLLQENNELKQKVKNVNELEDELRVKISNAKRDFYNEKMRTLIESITNTNNTFYIYYDFEKKPKCNCCDKDRKITFTDNLGREYKVNCECNRNKQVYFYKKSDVTSIEFIKEGSSLTLFANFYSREYDYQTVCIYKNGKKLIEKFDENNPPERYDNVLFTDENEAKKYVDWLNKKEEEKENK